MALFLSTLEFYKINHVLCGGGKPPPYLTAEQTFSTNQISIFIAVLVEGPKGCGWIDQVRNALAAGPARHIPICWPRPVGEFVKNGLLEAKKEL